MDDINPRIRWPLAGINFFLADVRDGLGPFLAIYLISVLHWESGKIGLVMSIAGITTLILQTPAGAIIDNTHHKRQILIIASLMVAFAMLGIQYFPNFLSIAFNKIIVGASGAFFGPAIAGITLGCVGSTLYAQQVATNEAYNHAGNIFAAMMAAWLGTFIGLNSLFWFTAFMGICASIFALSLNKQYIDDNFARGFTQKNTQHNASSFLFLLEDKTLLCFAFSILLFHLANAAMLLIIGEEVALKNNATSSIFFVAGSIISAQFVMFFMALLVKKTIMRLGRKKLFVIGFIALPIRGLLFTLSADPNYLLLVQLLDGVGAGLFGALFPIVTADLTRGTGRTNVALGALSTMQGIGAALSTLVSGYLVEYYGFQFTFFILALIAVIALLLFVVAVPETKPSISRGNDA